MVRGAEGVELFSDVRRWIAVQAEELEVLRARHQKLTHRRKEAIVKIAQEVPKDTIERKQQVNDFSLEMEQLALAEFDVLKEDIVAEHVRQKSSESSPAGNDIQRKQRQINALAIDVDQLHGSLLVISGHMGDFSEKFCALPDEA
ncbi:unnamed protein product [Polarella glacialis]|uniref:Uncharacterized protein n=1 Tax=Polarella glacialis TaxID=89957 RepID=A0A813GWF4_POLGL|nr:unnamed protein product [Polarella glacialis]